jgi:hypothetical protein
MAAFKSNPSHAASVTWIQITALGRYWNKAELLAVQPIFQ